MDHVHTLRDAGSRPGISHFRTSQELKHFPVKRQPVFLSINYLPTGAELQTVEKTNVRNPTVPNSYGPSSLFECTYLWRQCASSPLSWKRVPGSHAANSQAASPAHTAVLKKRNHIRVPPIFIIWALITFHSPSNFSFRLPFWPVLSDRLSQTFPNRNIYFGDYRFHLLQTDFYLRVAPPRKIKVNSLQVILS